MLYTFSENYDSAQEYCEIRRTCQPAIYNNRRINEAPIPNIHLPIAFVLAEDLLAVFEENQFELVQTVNRSTIEPAEGPLAVFEANQLQLNAPASASRIANGMTQAADDPLAQDQLEQSAALRPVEERAEVEYIKTEIELNDADFFNMLNEWEAINNVAEIEQQTDNAVDDNRIPSDDEGFVGLAENEEVPAPIMDNIPDGYLKREHDAFSGNIPYADAPVRICIYLPHECANFRFQLYFCFSRAAANAS